MNKAFFLDRDGVVNKELDYVYRKDDFYFIDGVFEACQTILSHGYEIILITNQSGIARGYYSEEDFLKLTKWMVKIFMENGVTISDVMYCPHHATEGLGVYKVNCECRKPKTGLLVQIRNALKQDLQGAYMVGDSLKDLQAAKAVGITPILVRTGNGLQTLQELSTAGLENVEVFNDLASFVDHIL